MENVKLNEENKKPTGRYRFKTYRAGTKDLIRTSEWNENLIVSGVGGYGLNVICRTLGGDTSIPLAIDELQMGTGTTAPVAGNTGLQTPVVTGISRAGQVITATAVTLEFFLSDLEVPNGTYNEVGIFCGNPGNQKLFARSIISPAFTKATAEDTEIEYEISFTAI